MNSKIKNQATRKRFFLISAPILVGLMMILTQCDKETGCKDVICTEEFRTISLQLKYPEGQVVLLDSSKVFWVGKNRYLEQDPVTWNSAQVWGSYAIVDDGLRKELFNGREVMRFTGYLSGEIICERDVLVGADCCHVDYLGKESLNVIVNNSTNGIAD